MSSTNLRYSLFPQMIHYDQMPAGRFVPYSMLSGPFNYQSECINTDRMGFRLSKYHNKAVGVEAMATYDKVNIIIGGSTVFGVGASSDATCISSLLSDASENIWLNMGIRGCNSFQEYIHLVTNLCKTKKVERVVFVSGINDLYLSIVNDETSDYDYGFGTKYSNLAGYHPYRQSAALFFAGIYGREPEQLVNESLFKMAINKCTGKKQDVKTKITSLEEKVGGFLRIYKRNVNLYKGLSAAYDLKVDFVLQPFINWTKKKITDNEQQVMDYLTELQRDSHWREVKELLLTPGIKEEIVNWFDKEMSEKKINFIDGNSLFDGNDKDCFVDSVHMSDEGNRIIADLILKL